MTSKIYLQTGKDQLVDATEIVPHSVLLNELKETYDDEPIEVMVGDPDTVYQQTLDAVEAIKILPKLTKLLTEFNHPVTPADTEISFKIMKELHYNITNLKVIWKTLSKRNPVYNWLFPLPEYTRVVKCKTDIYSYYRYKEFPNKRQCRYQIFLMLCKYNKLKIAQWVYSLGGVEHKDSIFEQTCKYGNLEVVQFVYSLGDVDIHANNEQAFLNACDMSHWNIVKWLVSLGVNIHSFDEYVFVRSCEKGNLEMAQWVYSLGDVNIHVCDDSAFHKACIDGHLEVAQWLYSLGDVNINDDVICTVCMYNNLKVAKWLYSLKHVNVLNNYVFTKVCSYGHLEVAKWILSLGNIRIHYENDLAFRIACKNGNIEVAKWLYSKGKVNIHAINEEAFREACINNHLKIAQWLYSLGGVNIHANNNHAIKYSRGSIAKWLNSLK